jgi:hypothetical protein
MAAPKVNSAWRSANSCILGRKNALAVTESAQFRGRFLCVQRSVT